MSVKLRILSLRSAIVLGLICLVSSACTPPADPRDLTINLRWVKGYPRESKTDVETGLMWTLSFLGAEFPSGAPKAFIWHDHLVILDLDRVGLPEGARPVWERLLAVMKKSDEYRKMGGIDVGRFVMLTLCSPNHYYALTQVAQSLAEVRQRHRFEAKQMAILESGIASGNRLLEIGAASKYSDIAFIGYEGTGELRDLTFEKKEIEVLDSMKNGQLRFALYDLDGHLKPNASRSLTAAGTPAKCLWCHEINLQPAMKNKVDLGGYHTTKEFDEIIYDRMKIVRAYRNGLDSKVKFSRTEDHGYAELLYLTFMEPSIQRLAMEWKVPIDQAARLVKDKPTHAQAEMEMLGKFLYRRQDVDALAPYQVIKVPSDPREPSDYEPDLLQATAVGTTNN
jgi:hypothetical protein